MLFTSMRLLTLKTIKLLSLLLLPVLFSHGVVASQNEAAPHFEAKDAAGNAVDLSVLRGRYIVLEWTNADCPFVKALQWWWHAANPTKITC